MSSEATYPKVRTSPDGKRTIISDPPRGIGITYERMPTDGLWIVVTCFTRIDTGRASEGYAVDYGLN